MKKILSILLVLLVVSCSIVPAKAADGTIIEPRYTYVNTVSAGLTIDQSSGLANCSGRVIAKNTYPVTVVVKLQVFRNGMWNDITSWTSSGTMNAYASGKYVVTRGAQYRAYVTGYVYNSSGVLQESVNSEQTVYYPST